MLYRLNYTGTAILLKIIKSGETKTKLANINLTKNIQWMVCMYILILFGKETTLRMCSVNFVKNCKKL